MNHETHQDIESADFATLNPAAALLQGLDGRTHLDEPAPAVSGNCIDNQGYRTEHRATGYLMSEGRRISPQCEHHAAEVIAEYEAHGLTGWSFQPASQV